MKRFLLSSFALFLCVGVSVAQRYTASDETEIANIYGTKTYSYILKDGSRVYDGPTTIKASFDDWRYIEVYGNEYHAHIKRNCSITANYRNDCLNGALKANHNYSLYALRETVGNNTYFSGNFLKGVPNGDFLLEHTDTEYGGNTKMEVYLKATYKNGLLVGPFEFSDLDAFRDGSRSFKVPCCEITGNFSSTGKMTGLWHIVHHVVRQYGERSLDYVYKFHNGVLVEGGSNDLDAKEKALAIKYANGQITEKGLAAHNLIVLKEQTLYTYDADDNLQDLYSFVVERVSDIIYFDIKWWTSDLPEGVGIYYDEVCRMSLLSDEEFKSYLATVIIPKLNETKTTYYKVDDLLEKEDEVGRYHKNYDYLTDSQVKQVKELVDKHNANVEKIVMEEVAVQVKNKYLNRAGAEITVDSKSHDIVAIRVLSFDKAKNALKLEIDSREYKQTTGDDYILLTHKCNYVIKGDGGEFTDLTSIRNKYSDVADAKKSADAELDSALSQIAKLEEQRLISRGNLLDRQVTAFRDYYVRDVKNVKINHSNLDETVAHFRDAVTVIKNFKVLLPKYAEASKLNDQIVEKNISKYTTTAMPQFAVWSKDEKVELVNKTIVQQKLILKLCEEFSALKSKVDEAHRAVVTIKDPLLSQYQSLYVAATKKTTLDKAIEAYTDFIPVQEKVIAQWKQYSELKSKVDKAHKELSATSDKVLTEYRSLYSTMRSQSTDLDRAIVAYTNFIPVQEKTLAQWKQYSELKGKVDKSHRELSSTGDRVLTEYRSLYSTMRSQSTSLDKAIEAYTNFIPVQEKTLALWKEYSALKSKVDKAHRVLSATNDKVLAKYLSSYSTLQSQSTSLDKAITAYTNFITTQEKTLEQWNEYSELRKRAIEVHKQVMDNNAGLLGEYPTFYGNSIMGISSLENGIASYKYIITKQGELIKYIAIYKRVLANNVTLPTILKPAKCAAKAYKTYFEGINFGWKVDGSVEKISKIWAIQQVLAKIPQRPTLKQDEKRVKKAKLTDIEEIIKVYYNVK